MLGVMSFPLLNLSLNKQPALRHEESLTFLQMNDTRGHNKKTHLSSKLKCWDIFVDRKRGVFGEDFLMRNSWYTDIETFKCDLNVSIERIM